MILVDSHYYGGLVIAPLNILLYNVFSDHGPDIYGVEPWTFYFVNGFLNFNVVFIMALASLPVMLFVGTILKQPQRGEEKNQNFLDLIRDTVRALVCFSHTHPGIPST